LLGVPAVVIATVAPIHLFAQFWYHTQHINRMGFLEKIIVTPAHHRVHHAINKEYIDKNYSQIFIFWDKLFGTFQEELPDVKPVYGITRPVHTWNPIKINFQHLWLLTKDAWHTKSLKDKLRIWIMPTGWRPSDVQEQYPVFKIENVYNFEKYAPKTQPLLTVWIWIQLVMLLLLVSYLFGNIAAIGSPGMFWYGGFIFVFVYAYTELMDGNKYAIAWEIGKAAMGIAIIFITGDWFGANKFIPWISNFLVTYLVLSAAVTGWLVYAKVKEVSNPLPVSV
jgi:alkylglycerol monooxygenase